MRKKFKLINRLLKSPRIIPSILRNYLSILILRKKSLRNLQLAVTYDCQYNCSLCATRELKNNIETLSIEQIRRIIKEVKSLGCINVNLTGGEPLLRQDLDKIIRIISRNGLMAGLITNGGFLGYDLLRKLKSSGLTEVAISIHGNEEYHDMFTGIKGAYRKAVRSLEMAKEERLSVVINTVVTHRNLKERGLEGIKKIARDYGILIQPILLCFPHKNLINSGFSLTGEDLQTFNTLLKDPYIKPLHRNYLNSFCPAGNEYIYIGAYGDVFMCDLVQTPYGNVLQEPLVRIWQRMLNKRKVVGEKHLCVGLENND